MLRFLSYNTPAEFYSNFHQKSIHQNFKLLRLLSLCGLILGLLSRIVGTLYLDELKQYALYEELSNANWIAIFGHLSFYLISFLKFKNQRVKQVINLLFALFVLAIGLYISYVNSNHHTKNTMTMLLVSILVVGVFFVFEKLEVLLLSVLLTVLFLISVVGTKITILDIVLNIAIGLILSMVLILFLKYNYYFQSKNFVKVQLLKQKNNEIAMLNRQKNDVLAYVLHDLRSPLANIEMLNNFTLEEQPHLQEAKLIQQSTAQAAHIINDLLDVLKHNTEDKILYEVDVNDLLSKKCEQWRKSTGRIINYQMHNNDVVCLSNPSKIERVFENLFQNANKFSSADKAIDIVLKCNTTSIEIEFKDYGIGIPTTFLNCLFEQFTPASRKGLQGEKSIGIGLHLSKKIVEEYQGALTVESVENEGSTFIVKLPRA